MSKMTGARNGVTRRKLMTTAAGFAAAPSLILSTAARAAWPTDKPIRVVVPNPPGGATDIMARLISPPLAEALGTSVYVENKGGGGGNIGISAVQKSEPDGYTLLAASGGAVTLNPLVQKTPYDPERDLAPVAMIGLSPMVLVTRADFPANTLQEFLAVVRANPGRFN